MHDKCNCYSRNCYYKRQDSANSIDPPYCDLFSIIIISIGHGTQEQGINLSLIKRRYRFYFPLSYSLLFKRNVLQKKLRNTDQQSYPSNHASSRHYSSQTIGQARKVTSTITLMMVKSNHIEQWLSEWLYDSKLTNNSVCINKNLAEEALRVNSIKEVFLHIIEAFTIPENLQTWQLPCQGHLLVMLLIHCKPVV